MQIFFSDSIIESCHKIVCWIVPKSFLSSSKVSQHIECQLFWIYFEKKHISNCLDCLQSVQHYDFWVSRLVYDDLIILVVWKLISYDDHTFLWIKWKSKKHSIWKQMASYIYLLDFATINFRIPYKTSKFQKFHII